MKIGIVGCGFVFDHYMTTLPMHPGLEIAGLADIDSERLARASAFYGLKAYPDVDALLSDPEITIVANLTSIEAHYAVSKRALEAGKHVYSEKPLVTSMAEARDLFELAEARGLRLSCAPSNALGATARTLWRVIEDGAIGDVRLIYAEFDDNPVYLMNPETWRSRSGAPWPHLHEYEMGCTWEHVGYHLTWMCAIFGPVRAVTAFSKKTLPDKTTEHLEPDDTPDFSVACLDFHSGVTGRITCSIAAPYDHRMRIIGNQGMAHADTYRHYECPVYVEPFTKLSLNARNMRGIRTSTWLQGLFGIGGRRVPLAICPPPGVDERIDLDGPRWHPGALLRRWKRAQMGQQDKCLGIAELAAAIAEDRLHFPPHEFTLHLTELTLAIQAAGSDGRSTELESYFQPLLLPGWGRGGVADYKAKVRRATLDRFIGGTLERIRRNRRRKRVT